MTLARICATLENRILLLVLWRTSLQNRRDKSMTNVAVRSGTPKGFSIYRKAGYVILESPHALVAVFQANQKYSHVVHRITAYEHSLEF